MRLLRQPMTVPTGQTASNPINLGSEKLVGIYVQALGGGSPGDLRIQNLISGNEDDPESSQVWSDVYGTATDNPPATDGGYVAELLAFDSADLLAGRTILLPRGNVGYPLPVVRVVHAVAPTGTPTIVRMITDPHS